MGKTNTRENKESWKLNLASLGSIPGPAMNDLLEYWHEWGRWGGGECGNVDWCGVVRRGGDESGEGM